MPLSEGETAPDFALPLEPGEAPLRLSDYRDQKPVVLLFFPLAFSGVCTKEMRLVAEDYDRWRSLDAEVVGVSVDSPFVNRKFAEETGAPFPIVSDFNREATDAYGVRDDDFYGLEGVSKRAAFVVDREGEIAYAWCSDDASVLPDFDAIEAAVEEVG